MPETIDPLYRRLHTGRCDEARVPARAVDDFKKRGYELVGEDNRTPTQLKRHEARMVEVDAEEAARKAEEALAKSEAESDAKAAAPAKVAKPKVSAKLAGQDG